MGNSIVSPAGTMEGWNTLAWLKGNKESAKLVVTALAGVATYFIGAHLNPALQVVATGAVLALVKLGLDSIDFYTSDVKLG